jgi:hypothetical protein
MYHGLDKYGIGELDRICTATKTATVGEVAIHTTSRWNDMMHTFEEEMGAITLYVLSIDDKRRKLR